MLLENILPILRTETTLRAKREAWDDYKFLKWNDEEQKIMFATQEDYCGWEWDSRLKLDMDDLTADDWRVGVR